MTGTMQEKLKNKCVSNCLGPSLPHDPGSAYFVEVVLHV